VDGVDTDKDVVADWRYGRRVECKIQHFDRNMAYVCWYEIQICENIEIETFEHGVTSGFTFK